MGLLDQVIGAALGSMGQSAPQGQRPPGQPAQDQFSQIAAILTSLLAPRPAAAAGQQEQAGGLDVLIDQLKKNGFEDVINSWIGTGQNQAISPDELREALGQKTVNDLSRQAGTPQEDLFSQLSNTCRASSISRPRTADFQAKPISVRTIEGIRDTSADVLLDVGRGSPASG